MMEYGTDSSCIVENREINLIQADKSVQLEAFIQEGRPSKRLEVREKRKNDEKDSSYKTRQPESRRKQERRPVTLSTVACYLYYSFDRGKTF